MYRTVPANPARSQPRGHPGARHRGGVALARRLLKNRVTVAVYRSTAVHEPARFVRNELFRPVGTEAWYRLRRAPLHFGLRHRSRDLEIFHEVLFGGLYAPPPEVAAALAGAPDPRVVDLGANIGLYGVRVFEDWPLASIVAFEPDPDNIRLLEHCIERNGAAARWQLVPAFAAPAAGEVRFRAGMESYSRQARDADSEGVVVVPAVDVFPYLEAADLLKMDIEGAEWPILEDPRLRSTGIRALLLEYHGEAGDEAQRAALAALAAGGFNTRQVFRDDAIGIGVLWAWR